MTTTSHSDQEPKPALDEFPAFFFAVFGIALPALTTVIESVTRMCAGSFFDPLPTYGHIAIVALVPILNLAAFVHLRRPRVPRRVFSVVAGLAFGVSAIYALAFLPLLPLAVPGVFFAGLGFLPLSPLLAVVAGLFARNALRRVSQLHGVPVAPFFRGAIAAVALVAAVDLPRAFTRFGLHSATSTNPETRRHGLALLERFGSENELRRLCSSRGSTSLNVFAPLFWWSNPVPREQARHVYYIVTGTLPENAPPTDGILEESRAATFVFDANQGGSVVGASLPDLSLTSSRIDGSVDGQAALAYVEWILEFRNGGLRAQEARAQVALPPGGVVSRVTLWVNGEEREAAIGSRSQARTAYETVVRSQRDPLLVTTAGPDRVLVQCFPVPPAGGTMKIRIGITAPLSIATHNRASLALPHFVERNFPVPDGFAHAVWFESRSPLSADNASLVYDSAPGGAAGLRGEVLEHTADRVSVRVERGTGTTETRAVDSSGGAEAVVVQTVKETTAMPPAHVFLVLDCSRTTKAFLDDVAASIEALPRETGLEVLFANGEPGTAHDQPKAASPARLIRGAPCRGGVDNIPALVRAWDKAAEHPRSAIVWMHAPQPLIIESPSGLRQRFDRRPDGPFLISVPVSRGPDRIIEQLDGIEGVRELRRHSTLRADVEDLFRSWGPGARLYERSWHRERRTPASLPRSSRTSDHLVRLWAQKEIRRLAAAPATRSDAVEMAALYRLVTPVSGAVVLETQAQEKAAGLDPAAPQNIPTVPEPGTWAVVAVIVLVLIFAFRRREATA